MIRSFKKNAVTRHHTLQASSMGLHWFEQRKQHPRPYLRPGLQPKISGPEADKNQRSV